MSSADTLSDALRESDPEKRQVLLVQLHYQLERHPIEASMVFPLLGPLATHPDWRVRHSYIEIIGDYTFWINKPAVLLPHMETLRTISFPTTTSASETTRLLSLQGKRAIASLFGVIFSKIAKSSSDQWKEVWEQLKLWQIAPSFSLKNVDNLLGNIKITTSVIRAYTPLSLTQADNYLPKASPRPQGKHDPYSLDLVPQDHPYLNRDVLRRDASTLAEELIRTIKVKHTDNTHILVQALGQLYIHRPILTDKICDALRAAYNHSDGAPMGRRQRRSLKEVVASVAVALFRHCHLADLSVEAVELQSLAMAMGRLSQIQEIHEETDAASTVGMPVDPLRRSDPTKAQRRGPGGGGGSYARNTSERPSRSLHLPSIEETSTPERCLSLLQDILTLNGIARPDPWTPQDWKLGLWIMISATASSASRAPGSFHSVSKHNLDTQVRKIALEQMSSPLRFFLIWSQMEFLMEDTPTYARWLLNSLSALLDHPRVQDIEATALLKAAPAIPPTILDHTVSFKEAPKKLTWLMASLLQLAAEQSEKILTITDLACHWAQDPALSIRLLAAWLIRDLRPYAEEAVADRVEQRALEHLRALTLVVKVEKVELEPDGRPVMEAISIDDDGDGGQGDGDGDIVMTEGQVDSTAHPGPAPSSAKKDDGDLIMEEALTTTSPNDQVIDTTLIDERPGHPAILPSYYASPGAADEYVTRHMHLFLLATARRHALLLRLIHLYPSIPVIARSSVRAHVHLPARSLGPASPVLAHILRIARHENLSLIQEIMECTIGDAVATPALIRIISENRNISGEDCSRLSIGLLTAMSPEEVIYHIPAILALYPEDNPTPSADVLGTATGSADEEVSDRLRRANRLLSAIVLKGLLPASDLIRAILGLPTRDTGFHKPATLAIEYLEERSWVRDEDILQALTEQLNAESFPYLSGYLMAVAVESRPGLQASIFRLVGRLGEVRVWDDPHLWSSIIELGIDNRPVTFAFYKRYPAELRERLLKASPVLQEGYDEMIRANEARPS